VYASGVTRVSHATPALGRHRNRNPFKVGGAGEQDAERHPPRAGTETHGQPQATRADTPNLARLTALLTTKRVAALRTIGTKGRRRHPGTKAWFGALADELQALVPARLHPDDDGWHLRYFRAIANETDDWPEEDLPTPTEFEDD
jgi:hypothetical protein